VCYSRSIVSREVFAGIGWATSLPIRWRNSDEYLALHSSASVGTTLLTLAFAAGGALAHSNICQWRPPAGGVSCDFRPGRLPGLVRRRCFGGGDAAGEAIRAHRGYYADDVITNWDRTNVVLGSSTSAGILTRQDGMSRAAINAARGQLPTNLPQQSFVPQVEPGRMRL